MPTEVAMPRSLIVISDDDTEPELIESWLHVARTIAGEGRTGRSDAICDVVLERREGLAPAGSVTPGVCRAEQDAATHTH